MSTVGAAAPGSAASESLTVPGDRTVVFSPFGLGVLDPAVGKHVYDEVARSGGLQVIEDFFHELRRHG
jgi:N-[(2S)-2-amino-2-carboxyethyl]-L-glutamate dehydrogenase